MPRGGQALGVVGPNGAGKTTLIDIVAGGRLPGREAGYASVKPRCHHRLARPRARLGLRPHLPGAPPLRLDDRVRERPSSRPCAGDHLRRRAAHAAAYAALARTGLAAKAGRGAHRLTLLERKRLELAHARSPPSLSVLLLDEIAGGLTEPETDALIGTIRAVHEAGTTIVWVEHIMRR